MTFTEQLADEAVEYWDQIADHPMVRQLGEGTLDEAPFRRWVRQDYVYLIDYGRVFALGAATAPDLARLGRFAELLDATINTEMDLHRSYAAEFGISESELAATEPNPTTQGYTDFLVRTASHGTFGETVAALLPCMWGFNATAERLAERGRPDHDGYAQWIDMYAGEEFSELADWCRELLDDVAAEVGSPRRERFRELFRTSARYEYRFWDAAYRGEEWEL